MLRQSLQDSVLMPALANVLGAGQRAARTRRPHVVIVGAGFAGLNAAMGLCRADVDVTVIDRRNYHLFQPLLYQVATAGLSPAQIATPIRRILAKQKNATVLFERVEGVDTRARQVLTSTRRISYDYLILATGARHAYFGHDEVTLGHNDDPPIPGLGSAIFLHVARPDYTGTEGCVALALPDLLQLLTALRPNDALQVVSA
jgi:NADH dehydrogenase